MNPQRHGAGLIPGLARDGVVAALALDECFDCVGHDAALPQVRFGRKRDLTRGEITNGKFPDMDTDWSRLTEDYERVRWARTHAKFGTARAAAESLGIGENTYSAYERPPEASKSTRLEHQRAIQFGRKFKVSWTWLLAGEGTPFDKDASPAQQRILSAMADLDDERQDQVAQAVEILVRTGTGG